jgi:DNA-directed RNA polymerase specialized sigma24 family protein
VADPAELRDYLSRRHRRLHTYLRVLLPDAAEAEAALDDVVSRIGTRATEAPAKDRDGWIEGIARAVAADRRKRGVGAFSDDLFRQLADLAGPVLDQIERTYGNLPELLRQLPPPERELLHRRYELGLTAEQMGASEGRPVSTVVRDLTGLHETLVSALRRSGEPAAPGGAADLGRLTHQLLDGTMSDDSRIVFETLLLADPPAQTHYIRHVALVTELTWKYGGVPPVPEWPAPTESPRVSRREKIVTGAFIAACTVVIVFLILLFAGFIK